MFISQILLIRARKFEKKNYNKKAKSTVNFEMFTEFNRMKSCNYLFT